MTLLPFYCDVSKFDGPTQKKLAENNVVMSFFKGEDSIFDNIQRIIYKKGTQCCVVYVGYTVNHVSFMIQVSEQYLKTVATFGNADLKNNEVFLNTTISEKRIPFFYKMFIRGGCEHDAHFYLEPESAEMLCIQVFKIGEIKTEKDFQKCIFMIMQIGQKIFAEFETAIEAENKSNRAKDISALIRLIFHFM